MLARVIHFRALLLVAVAASCKPAAVQVTGPGGNAPVMSVTVAPLASTISVGASQPLTATVRDAAGSALTGRAVAWGTSNAAVAQVTGDGKVNAMSPGGPVTITATSEGKSGTASVTVTAPAPTLVRVILTPDTASVTAGATRQFAAQGRMSDSTTVAVAAAFTATGGTISVGGLYTAGATPGTFHVIATALGKADTSGVTIASVNSYTTTFDVDENPLTEGGRWRHTDPTLTQCKVVGGRAFGTQSGTEGYDDSNAYLTGYGDNYEVEGTVWLNPGLSGPENREVEILLRWTDDGPLRSTAYGPTHANGYEINAQHAGQYMTLGRFKGALLVQVDNFAAPKTGDRFRVRIEGQRIRVWWNDVLMIDFTDSDASLWITTGNPGIGFFTRASNTDFGFESMTVRPL